MKRPIISNVTLFSAIPEKAYTSVGAIFARVQRPKIANFYFKASVDKNILTRSVGAALNDGSSCKPKYNNINR